MLAGKGEASSLSVLVRGPTSVSWRRSLEQLLAWRTDAMEGKLCLASKTGVTVSGLTA